MRMKRDQDPRGKATLLLPVMLRAVVNVRGRCQGRVLAAYARRYPGEKMTAKEQKNFGSNLIALLWTLCSVLSNYKL